MVIVTASRNIDSVLVQLPGSQRYSETINIKYQVNPSAKGLIIVWVHYLQRLPLRLATGARPRMEDWSSRMTLSLYKAEI